MENSVNSDSSAEDKRMALVSWLIENRPHHDAERIVHEAKTLMNYITNTDIRAGMMVLEPGEILSVTADGMVSRVKAGV